VEQRGEVNRTSRREFTKENIGRVREGPGVYKLYAYGAKKPTYIGSGKNLPERLKAQKRESRYHSFDVDHTDTTRQARAKEKRMIRRNQPRRNRQLL
jgi:excinuclease UvrABC nuclease subunit